MYFVYTSYSAPRMYLNVASLQLNTCSQAINIERTSRISDFLPFLIFFPKAIWYLGNPNSPTQNGSAPPKPSSPTVGKSSPNLDRVVEVVEPQVMRKLEVEPHSAGLAIRFGYAYGYKLFLHMISRERHEWGDIETAAEYFPGVSVDLTWFELLGSGSHWSSLQISPEFGCEGNWELVGLSPGLSRRHSGLH